MDNPIMGELIINIMFQKELAHFKTEIDLSAQPSGMYLINLILEQYRANRKLIVE